MFNKLLANLPFNPSLVAQISLYGKRLRRESSIRRIGFVFVALALVVQVFAVVSPPQPSLASSPTNLVNSGFTSREQAVQDCSDPAQDYGKILAFYGITCADIATPSTTTVVLRSTDYHKQLFSMSRHTQPKGGDQPVNIPDTNHGQPLYLRPLWIWDTYAFSTYAALSGMSSRGLPFFILFDSGNVVFIGLPPSPTPPAASPLALQPHQSAANLTQHIAHATQANAGDIIEYTLTTTNSGTTVVHKFAAQENISDVLDYADVVDFHGGSQDSQQLVSWPAVDMKPQVTLTRLLSVRIKAPIPATPVSSSDPGHFDHRPTNTYGNTVVISLPPTFLTVAQTITTALPNTGPATSLIGAFAVTLIAGYFFVRSRVLAKEADLVRSDYASAGGSL